MKARGKNQVKLAEAAGVSQGSISKLLNAESLEGVTAALIARLALGLDVSSGFILTGEGDVIPTREELARAGGVLELDEAKDELVPAPKSRPRPVPTHRKERPRRS